MAGGSAEQSAEGFDILGQLPMSRLQIAAVATTMRLDGFDVLAISFASAGIVNDWGIDRAVIGGAITAQLLDGGHWRMVFEFGAIATALFIPLVWFFVSESVDYLAKK